MLLHMLRYMYLVLTLLWVLRVMSKATCKLSREYVMTSLLANNVDYLQLIVEEAIHRDSTVL